MAPTDPGNGDPLPSPTPAPELGNVLLSPERGRFVAWSAAAVQDVSRPRVWNRAFLKVRGSGGLQAWKAITLAWRLPPRCVWSTKSTVRPFRRDIISTLYAGQNKVFSCSPATFFFSERAKSFCCNCKCVSVCGYVCVKNYFEIMPTLQNFSPNISRTIKLSANENKLWHRAWNTLPQLCPRQAAPWAVRQSWRPLPASRTDKTPVRRNATI